MINALMPGEHDWMNGPVASSAGGPWTPSPSVPSMTPQSARGANVPGKKPNPLMNALGVAATTLFSNDPAASFQRKKDMQLGNALAMNDYEGAAQMALNQGNLDQGMKMRDLGTAYTEQQKATEAETRQKEAQQVYQLFSNMQPLQINEFAMADPAGFEQATGMSSEEYLQSAQRMMQVGMSPEQFHQYVIQQAQAELGMGGSVEGKVVNNRLVNPVTGEVIGDYSDPRAPIEVNGVLVDPTTFEPVADYRTPTQTGAMTEYQLADLDLRRNKSEAAGASKRPYEKDQNDVLRYVDNGEPVFPGVEGGGGVQPVPGLPPPTTSIDGLPAGVVGTYARSDEKALDAARTAASESRNRATLTQQFVDKAKNYGAQGQGFFNDVGQALSMKTSDLNRITSELGPTQRPEGSGSTSDKDMQIYLTSTVNVNNTKGTNQDVAAMENALADRDAAYLQWIQDYTAAYPTPGASRDAKRLWDEYSYAPENQLFSVNEKGRVQVKRPPDIMTWLESRQGGTAPANPTSGFESQIPPEALAAFYSDREPDADEEFDRTFGRGAAQWARLQRAKYASGMQR